MPITTDPNDPRLGHGPDTKPHPQQEAYIVLSKEERTKSFVRPVRHSYKHVGLMPNYPLLDLTDEQKERFGDDFVKFEKYPESETGRYWTQAELDRIGKGCGTVTSMNQAIAETYARSPNYYSDTYCMGCRMHKPVNEFVWEPDGTVVGS